MSKGWQPKAKTASRKALLARRNILRIARASARAMNAPCALKSWQRWRGIENIARRHGVWQLVALKN